MSPTWSVAWAVYAPSPDGVWRRRRRSTPELATALCEGLTPVSGVEEPTWGDHSLPAESSRDVDPT